MIVKRAEQRGRPKLKNKRLQINIRIRPEIIRFLQKNKRAQSWLIENALIEKYGIKLEGGPR